jgi:hypothetical protein
MGDSTQQAVVTRYKRYGLMGGFALGLLVGIMISGPHLREWQAWQSLLVIFGGGVLGSFVGYVALSVVMGSFAAGSGGGFGGGGTGAGGGHSAGDSGGDGGGGGDG